MVALVLLRSCLKEHVYVQPIEEIKIEYPLDLHDYDFSRLRFEDSFACYEDEKYTSKVGIDVSVHQKEIDWAKVKEAGIEFAFIRVGYRGYTEGIMHDDDYFEANIKGAKENGIPVGIYYFSQAVTLEEAAEEAQYVIEHLEGYEIDLPVVFDMEEPDNGDHGRTMELSRQQQTDIALEFLALVERAGYTPMIYDSALLYERDYDLQYLQGYRFWVADYSSRPKYPYVFDIWQYSSSGHVDGVEGRCDMDLMLIEKDPPEEEESD